MHSDRVSARAARDSAASHVAGLVLSVFPGIDLLGRAFDAEGFHVLRGPDILWGCDIRDFTPPARVFECIIGGSPCQDFSQARRSSPTGEGIELLNQFCRVVEMAEPEWFLLENTPRVPDVTVQGYTMQRFFLQARDCGCRQNRQRRFQFGSLDGVGLVIPAPIKAALPAEPCVMASEGARKHRRTFADFCELQGLPRSFDLPGLSVEAKYKAVGNGVPLPMGRVLAIAVATRTVTHGQRVCVCGCGRVPSMAANHFSAACRKRMERSRRDSAGVSGPGMDAPTESRRDDPRTVTARGVTCDFAADRDLPANHAGGPDTPKTTAQEARSGLRTVTPDS